MAKLNLEPLNASELAILFGITPKTVWVLADKGIVVKNADGKFDVATSVQSYIAYKARTRAKITTEDEDRARLMKAKADIEEMEAAKMAGELVDSVSVETEWVDRAIRFKQRIRACSVKLAPLMVHVETEAEAVELLETVHDEALLELGSDEIQSIEPVDEGSSGGESGGDATAEDDGEPVG